MENWVSIKGYNSEYEVSDMGRIRSLKYGKIRILKHGTDTSGYHCVCLTLNGKCKTHLVHHLVWHNFKGDSLLTIDHKKEGDKSNNRLDNLQEIPHRDNVVKYYRAIKNKLTGTHLDKRRGTWAAEIIVNGKRKFLGSFKTELLASQAYQSELNNIKTKQNVN